MITLYQIKNHKRSAVLVNACRNGLRSAGREVQIRWEDEYQYPETEVAVFYGYCNNLPRIMDEYATAIYVDLGYWNRKPDDLRFTGYHKISVNSRHPTDYFQNRKHKDDRLKKLGIKIKPWKMGDHILVTGMSGKGAIAEGFKPTQWETMAIEAIREHTARPIYYRPKPSWKMATPVLGSTFKRDSAPLVTALSNCHALVAHHSNCAVEALIHGVPAFVMGGVAKSLSLQNFAKIDDPYYPEDRHQWAADIAWTQFNTDELATKLPWDHLTKEGFL